MAQTVIMPKLGQTVEESTVVKWHKKEGEKVKKGEILFEIETDKAVLEIESFYDGTLLKVLVAEGETVPVTSPVAFIGAPGDPLPEVKKLVPPQKTVPVSVPLPAQVPVQPGVVPPKDIKPLLSRMPAELPKHKMISPRAKKLVNDSAVSYESIRGTGPGGRIVEKDVIAYLNANEYDRIRITPAAKALAIKHAIDILSLEHDDKRLTVRDIRQAIAEKPEPLSKIRQIIAQRMTQSVTTTPHFFVTVSVDVTDLMAFREELKKKDISCSVTNFIIKALALALKEFPALNSTTDGKTVRWHSHIHIGMAVGIKDGLVVPVIRNADEINLKELQNQTASLASKAHEGKLAPDEMKNSTFTISNMGMLNVENFTAIINPGESAVLAVSSSMESPVVIKKQIVVRSIMKMTLSSDHRIVDGATAVLFINRIKSIIEDIELWKSMI